MQRFKIAVIAGDGVGQEVTPEAIRVLDLAAARADTAFEYDHHDWGAEYYLHHGRMMPADALDRLRGADAILLGAVGHPDIPDHITLNGLLLPIRRAFDQYANVRPAVLYPGVDGPLRSGAPIDMAVVREIPRANTHRWAAFYITASPTKLRCRRRSSRAAESSAWSPRLRTGGAAQRQTARSVHHEIQRAGIRNGVVGSNVSESRRRISGHRN
jgi:hypothetical protein